MLYSLVRPVLFALDPEMAHNLTLKALRGLAPLGLFRLMTGAVPALPRTVMGLSFPNPVGLAAGMDKNGEAVEAFGALGFGFIEVGTVTPRAQAGNPKPRIFRLPQVQALVNRMGFNNDGVDRLVENVRARRYRGILGVSIGKNADTPLERAKDDYVMCMQKVYACADYIAVNISSPNTKDLRTLQFGDDLNRLLERLKQTQGTLQREHGKYVPLAAKIAPDLTPDEIHLIAETLNRHDFDGAIATNTTLARDRVEGLPHAQENGGLSGAPLTERSNDVIRQLRGALKPVIPIIGSGGVMTPADARAKLEAGAALIQVYTGLIYSGPGLVSSIVRALGAHNA